MYYEDPNLLSLKNNDMFDKKNFLNNRNKSDTLFVMIHIPEKRAKIKFTVY